MRLVQLCLVARPWVIVVIEIRIRILSKSTGSGTVPETAELNMASPSGGGGVALPLLGKTDVKGVKKRL